MQLYSTKNKKNIVSLEQAVLQGLPCDNGLFMPTEFPIFKESFFEEIKDMSFGEIALIIATKLIGDSLPYTEIRNIVLNSINFPAPIVSLDEHTKILELFHGPTLAFKDFGARFMARIMGYFNRNCDKELTILVATSGDTGGAVASGFFKTPGINVIILYPKGKVSLLQEKQLTTLGHNITALEIEGSFDDCQALVKKAFLDDDIHSHMRISSANSINIARLIPQSFYYFEAWRQVEADNPVFVVPSGNFGNITAGLFAQKMGLPAKKFIAANNANDIFLEYLNTGVYKPMPSIQTISNAMDVGAPSNFVRILDLYGSTWNSVKNNIIGNSVSDVSTRSGIQEVYDKYDYIIDPHGSVAYLAFKAYQNKYPNDTGIILETAHPSKFIDVMPKKIADLIDIPERLNKLKDKKKVSLVLANDYAVFKAYLLSK